MTKMLLDYSPFQCGPNPIFFSHTHNEFPRKAGRAKLSPALVNPLNQTFREEVEVEYQYLDSTLTMKG